MAFPAPLGAQRAPPDVVPGDPTTLQGVLNRFEFIAYGLKFRGHSVPAQTVAMIKGARQSQLSKHQLNRLNEVGAHCRAFSKGIKGQPEEADPLKLKADLMEKERENKELRQKVRDIEKEMMKLRDVNSEQQDLGILDGKSTSAEPLPASDFAAHVASMSWRDLREVRKELSLQAALENDKALCKTMLESVKAVEQEFYSDPLTFSLLEFSRVVPMNLRHNIAGDYQYFHLKGANLLDQVTKSTLERLDALVAYARMLDRRNDLLAEGGFGESNVGKQSNLLEACLKNVRDLVEQNKDLFTACKEAKEATYDRWGLTDFMEKSSS